MLTRKTLGKLRITLGDDAVERMTRDELEIAAVELEAREADETRAREGAIAPTREPAPVRAAAEGRKRIAFYFRDNPYAFTPPDVYGKGVGGSEYALVFTAKALAAAGHDVTVYNSVREASEHDGVLYYPFTAYQPTGEDILCVYRVSYHGPRNADKFVFWSTDQYTDQNWGPMLPRLDAFLTISTFHRDYILSHYEVDADRVKILPLGVNWPDYELERERVPYKMIYCSVPHRGLDLLLNAWPRIRAEVPEAQLVVTSDYTLWGAHYQGNEAFTGAAERLRAQGVVPLWKVPRELLVRHQLTSELMPYPCTYDENFCISAAECIAAGAVPVVYAKGAVRETVGDAGIVVGDSADDPHLLNTFADSVIELAHDPARQARLRAYGRAWAREHYSYDAVAQRFLEACG